MDYIDCHNDSDDDLDKVQDDYMPNNDGDYKEDANNGDADHTSHMPTMATTCPQQINVAVSCVI